MAPKKSDQTGDPLTKAGTTRSDSLSVDASQEADNQYWRDFMHQRKQRTAERRSLRKQKILVAHGERIVKVNSKIKQTLQMHNEQMRAMRRPKVQRLIELYRQKSNLEERIDNCQAELEQAFLSTVKQLQLALEGRLEDLS